MEADVALGKPLFHMLAKHGPWEFHVRVKSLDAMNDAVIWLVNQAKIENTDFEVLVEAIQVKSAKKVFSPSFSSTRKTTGPIRRYSAPIQPIMFFNDPKLASYVKLTWG